MIEKTVIRIFVVAFLLLHVIISFAQVAGESASRFSDNFKDFDLELLEDLISENEDIDDPNLLYIFETLQSYFDNPLNLNTASESDLEDLFLLNQLQIQQFFSYKKKAGDLISVYELQAIPSFDLKTIRAILPFVRVSGEEQYQLSILEMAKESKRELVTRWIRPLQKQQGYQIGKMDEPAPYEGSPDKLLMRIRGNYENRLRFGITAEKDAGESLFSKSNPQGFDFYSAHLFLKDYSKTLKHLAIGDFSASFGQGLIAYSGFSSRKSSEVTKIDRERRVLRYFSSLNEIQFFRGAGVTLGLTDLLEVTAFGSLKKIDGNIFENDSLQVDPDFLEFETLTSSLQTSGLHRTQGEIEDEKQIGLFNLGGKIKFKKDTWHLSLNSIYHQLDKPLNKSNEPYNRFTFRGDKLLNLSTDYGFLFKNVKFFGETAWSDNGSVATVNGLLFGLGAKMSLAVLHRHLPADFHALNSRPFAESSQGSNENGLYLGVEINPDKNWKFQSYIDTWQHPWLRFQIDAPSKGVEYFTRLTFKQKRRMEAYLQIKNEIKERNAPENTTKTNYLSKHTQTRIRLHITNELTKSIKLRSRVEWSFFNNTVEPSSKGYMIFQDIIFKPMGFPLSFTTRFALFDTDDWDSRIYAYENDLLYTFSIPAYYLKGTRFYINLRYRPIKNLTTELRFERTYLSNREVFGSGYEASLGNTRNFIESQIKWEF